MFQPYRATKVGFYCSGYHRLTTNECKGPIFGWDCSSDYDVPSQTMDTSVRSVPFSQVTHIPNLTRRELMHDCLIELVLIKTSTNGGDTPMLPQQYLQASHRRCCRHARWPLEQPIGERKPDAPIQRLSRSPGSAGCTRSRLKT